MELWIRSQSKKILEKAEMIKIVKYENDNLYSIVVNNDYVFGEYQTEERALEILEEIQTAIIYCSGDPEITEEVKERLKSFVAMNLKTNSIVYEMPEV